MFHLWIYLRLIMYDFVCMISKNGKLKMSAEIAFAPLLQNNSLHCYHGYGKKIGYPHIDLAFGPNIYTLPK